MKSASHLPKMDTFGSCDPYAVLRLGSQVCPILLLHRIPNTHTHTHTHTHHCVATFVDAGVGVSCAYVCMHVREKCILRTQEFRCTCMCVCLFKKFFVFVCVCGR
jgi:hypothetical protein